VDRVPDRTSDDKTKLLQQLADYLFTVLNPNENGHSNKGLDKSPRFV
jgi:hypothetical protein